MQNLIEEFSSILNLDGFEISRLSPKIFICGGEILNEENSRFLSARDYFYRTIKNNNPDLFKRLVRAEDINQWIGDSYYDDLLELEKDLAGLVTAIPIFVESPGSLAELGSFAVIEEVSEKLLVFIAEEFFEKESFIWLGPLQRIMRISDETRVRPYRFIRSKDDHFVASDFAPYKQHVLEDIETYCTSNQGTGKFNKKNISHQILLMCDLLSVLVVAKLKDIRFIFEKLNLDHSAAHIKKCLWVADKMGMVKKIKSYGDPFYFVPLSTEPAYLSFSYKTGASKKDKDRDRWRMKFLESIKLDDRRRKALEEVEALNG